MMMTMMNDFGGLAQQQRYATCIMPYWYWNISMRILLLCAINQGVVSREFSGDPENDPSENVSADEKDAYNITLLRYNRNGGRIGLG
jgi:hypothetical protein